MEVLFFLFISLIIILFSCILFSNAVEWLGSKLNLSHGITGSILAAVGTALPETAVPLVAIFWGLNQKEILEILIHGAENHSALNQISIGAIIGAPFMLCTLAFFLIGLSSQVYFKSGKRKSPHIKVDESILNRDLKFFIISFSLSLFGIFLNHLFKVILAFILIGLYFIYLFNTLKEEKGENTTVEELEENLEPLYFSKLFRGIKPGLGLILSQVVTSLICLVFSAHHFVDAITELSHLINLPAFVISLLLTPLATELPEKFNSWMWIRNNKDTLAVGNVSGALVFQSTFPVSIGLLFTSWHITSMISYFIFLFCVLNSVVVLYAIKKQNLTYKTFLSCGIFYLIYLVLIIAMNL